LKKANALVGILLNVLDIDLLTGNNKEETGFKVKGVNKLSSSFSLVSSSNKKSIKP